ncbi:MULTISPECIES: hypothetical protein [unclassified Streptomyces]|uniref:hypothetical protein n=1 Tax=unclassified Streptomyces TaxID=2593676 RepID=UPI002DD99661|nr:hypothetical protein [Streptomyces sp. NBC_01763]WSC35617.1 hypothetical protein OHA08_08965 [Streptomyces sp. NBC_01763]
MDGRDSDADPGAREPAPFASDQLGESARLLRARMLDEADSATSRGKQWSATIGILSMTLTPAG